MKLTRLFKILHKFDSFNIKFIFEYKTTLYRINIIYVYRFRYTILFPFNDLWREWSIVYNNNDKRSNVIKTLSFLDRSIKFIYDLLGKVIIKYNKIGNNVCSNDFRAPFSTLTFQINLDVAHSGQLIEFRDRSAKMSLTIVDLMVKSTLGQLFSEEI